jgi:hypothetical protein
MLKAGVEGMDECGYLMTGGYGGPGGIRTPYLLTASQTFSQLNYGPTINVYLPDTIGTFCQLSTDRGTLLIYHKHGFQSKGGRI